MSLLEPPTAVHTRLSRKGVVRPMTGADVPAVARLFLKIFRGVDRPADQELQHYLCTLALTSPSHDERLGTQVYEQQDGRIRSALLAVPMQFVACGNVLPGRLLGVFMADAEPPGRRSSSSPCGRSVPISPSATAPRRRAATISSRSAASRSRYRTWNGRAASVPWRPLSGASPSASWAAGASAFPSSRVLSTACCGVGRLMRAPRSLVAPRSSRCPFAISSCRRRGSSPHYAVRPLWSEEELSWLVALAAQNTRLGAFTIRAVVDRTGAVIGSIVYYAAPGRTAHILNVLSLPGQEQAVLGAMFRHLDETGHVEARGRAQFALMAGLSSQRWLVFRHRAFAVALTRVPEINDAVARGDVYVGGLAGEDWSRLLGDFN
jgi:hypothetical protein